MTTIGCVLRKKGADVALSIACFPSERSLQAHCHEHFFNEAELWDRVFGREVLQKARKIWETRCVIDQEFYDNVADGLARAMHWAADVPLYAWSRQRVDDRYTRETVICLAEQGFVMIANMSALRTAYFPILSTKQSSAHELFTAAWKDTKKKLHVREYPDDKGSARVENLAQEWVSPENWAVCPNPHRKPKQPPRRPDQWYEYFKRQYRTP